MKTHLALLVVTSGLMSMSAFAQRPDTLTLDDYQAIYKGLEKRTDMFEKDHWTITDQRLISDVLFQLVNFQGEGDNELNRIRRGSEGYIKENREGLLRIECRKRSHDDEIERLDFYEMGGDGKPIASLTDYSYIRQLLGSTTYAKVRTNPTTHFDSRQGIVYDLYFHALNPEIMLWSTSPDSSHCYRLSGFARLGDDYLDLPFWFKGTIVSGLRLSYVDNTSLLNLDRDYTLYGLSVGVESPINFTVQTQEQQTGNSPFKSRKIEGSGTGIYLKASYTPWSRLNLITQNYEEQIQFVMEGSLALQEKKLYAWSIPDSFYSVRNYLTLAAYLKHVGLFNFGAGISWHDMHHVARYTPPGQPLRRLEPTTNNVLPFLEVGISEDGSLLQYALTTQVNYSVNENYGFFVVRSMLMLSNTIGIDVRYFKAIRSSGLPVWQYDNYLALSPVIRVNF